MRARIKRFAVGIAPGQIVRVLWREATAAAITFWAPSIVNDFFSMVCA